MLFRAHSDKFCLLDRFIYLLILIMKELILKFTEIMDVLFSFELVSLCHYVIYQTRDTMILVENTTCSGVFLTNFEVFDTVMKHCDECLI